MIPLSLDNHKLTAYNIPKCILISIRGENHQSLLNAVISRGSLTLYLFIKTLSGWKVLFSFAVVCVYNVAPNWF